MIEDSVVYQVLFRSMHLPWMARNRGGHGWHTVWQTYGSSIKTEDSF